jgi:hypothetical protein
MLGLNPGGHFFWMYSAKATKPTLSRCHHQQRAFIVAVALLLKLLHLLQKRVFEDRLFLWIALRMSRSRLKLAPLMTV